MILYLLLIKKKIHDITKTKRVEAKREIKGFSKKGAIGVQIKLLVEDLIIGNPLFK